jgi:CubicO group peptidase (beta-lactamase class C family)
LRRGWRAGPRIMASAAAAALTALALLAAGCSSSAGGAQVDPDTSTASSAKTVDSGTGGPPASASRRPPRSRDWRAFAGWLKQRAAAGKFSGAVLVAKDGKPVVKQANGYANRKRKRANGVDTKFNIASVGKTFTAVAIAQLVEEGKLSFDDPIGKYLSGFPPQVADTITIGQLLTHTSGLGDVFARWRPTGQSPLEVSVLMKRIVTEPLRFEPGSRFGYSNSGFVVLGAIIEAVTGQDYYEYVRERVFKPAGMTQTGWYRPDQVPNMARGYMQVDRNGIWVPSGRQPPPPGPRPGKPVAWRDSRGAGGAGNPSGGAYSTLADLFRFARALQNNRLLSPQTTETMLSGKVDTGRPGAAQVSKYGYGFEDEILNGVRIVGHGGGAPGIEAQLRIYPALGYTVIVLANQDAAALPVYQRASEMLTGIGRR